MFEFKIVVDADACPVKDIVCRIAGERSVEVIMVCDTAHIIGGKCRTVTVDKGRDSADTAIANMISKGDVVVTQDFGLAALVLAKGAFALNQNGLIYTDENLDKLLFERFLSSKSRRAGLRTKGPLKRKKEDNERFAESFIKVLDSAKNYRRI